MIRKYFVIGKQLFLQSKNLESYGEIGHVIELSIPVREYWAMQEMIGEANYLASSGDPKNEVLEFYRKVFLFSSKFAVYEKDRNWLKSRSQE